MKLVKKVFSIFLFLGFFNIVFGNSPTASFLGNFNTVYSRDSLYSVLIFFIFWIITFIIFLTALAKKFGEKNAKIISSLLSFGSTVTIFFILNKIGENKIHNILAANIFTFIVISITIWLILTLLKNSNVWEIFYLGGEENSNSSSFFKKSNTKKNSIIFTLILIFIISFFSIRSTSAIVYEVLRISKDEPNGYFFDFLNFPLQGFFHDLLLILFILLFFIVIHFLEGKKLGSQNNRSDLEYQKVQDPPSQEARSEKEGAHDRTSRDFVNTSLGSLNAVEDLVNHLQTPRGNN